MKVARRARHLTIFPMPGDLPGACPGVCPGEMLAAGIDSHITEILFKSSFHELLCCMLDISSLCELHLE